MRNCWHHNAKQQKRFFLPLAHRNATNMMMMHKCIRRMLTAKIFYWLGNPVFVRNHRISEEPSLDAQSICSKIQVDLISHRNVTIVVPRTKAVSCDNAALLPCQFQTRHGSLVKWWHQRSFGSLGKSNFAIFSPWENVWLKRKCETDLWVPWWILRPDRLFWQHPAK